MHPSPLPSTLPFSPLCSAGALFCPPRGIIYSDYTSECGYNPQSTSQCCACHFPSSPCNATPAPLPLTPPVLCLCLCTCQYPRVISACWPQQLQASPTIPSHNDHSWVTLITLLHMDSCSKAKKLAFRTLVTRYSPGVLHAPLQMLLALIQIEIPAMFIGWSWSLLTKCWAGFWEDFFRRFRGDE